MRQPLMTVRDAAVRLRVRESLLRSAIRRDSIPHYRIGPYRGIRIDPAQLRRISCILRN